MSLSDTFQGDRAIVVSDGFCSRFYHSCLDNCKGYGHHCLSLFSIVSTGLIVFVRYHLSVFHCIDSLPVDVRVCVSY